VCLITDLTRSISEDTSAAPARGSKLPPPPVQPLVIVEPSKSLTALNLRELWTYRELLYFLTWRDVKVRYKQTALGAAWAILQPVFMMMVFSLFFGRLAGVESKGVPYALFALAGLVPWTFFANAVTSSGNSLVGSSNLITKVYFPRALVPAAAVAAGLVDFIIAFLTLAVAMLYYRVGLTLNILMLPVLVMLTTLFALAVGMWMSALNVKYRDVRFALPFLIQIWLFVSSVIVPSTALPQKWRWLLLLNPMSAIVESFRAALFGQPFPWRPLGIATVITAAVLVYSTYSFKRVEKTFADII
jgi:lipopolysaccharide transport system permease protein